MLRLTLACSMNHQLASALASALLGGAPPQPLIQQQQLAPSGSGPLYGLGQGQSHFGQAQQFMGAAGAAMGGPHPGGHGGYSGREQGCFRCGDPSHWISDCPVPAPPRARSSVGSGRPSRSPYPPPPLEEPTPRSNVAPRAPPASMVQLRRDEYDSIVQKTVRLETLVQQQDKELVQLRQENERLRAKQRATSQKRKQRRQASQDDTQSASSNTAQGEQRAREAPARRRAAEQVAAAAAAAGASDSEEEPLPAPPAQLNFAAAATSPPAAAAGGNRGRRTAAAPTAAQHTPGQPAQVAMPKALLTLLQGIESFNATAVDGVIKTWAPGNRNAGKEKFTELYREIYGVRASEVPARQEALPKVVTYICDNWEAFATLSTA